MLADGVDRKSLEKFLDGLDASNARVIIYPMQALANESYLSI